MVAHQATLEDSIFLAEDMPRKLLAEYRPLLNDSHYEEHMAKAMLQFTLKKNKKNHFDLRNIKALKPVTKHITDTLKCGLTTDCDAWGCQAEQMEDTVNKVLPHAKFVLKPEISCAVGNVRLDVNAGEMRDFLTHGSVSIRQQTDLTVTLQLSDFVVDCEGVTTASRMIAAQGYAHTALADASEDMMPSLTAKRNRALQHLARSKSTYERLQNFTIPIHTLVDFSSAHPIVHDGALTSLLDEGGAAHSGRMDLLYQSMKRFVDGRITSLVKADDHIVSAMRKKNPVKALYLEVKTLFRSKFMWVGEDPVSFSVDLLKPIMEDFMRPYNFEWNIMILKLGLQFTPQVEMPLEGRLSIKGSGEVLIDMDGPSARFNLMGNHDPLNKAYEKGADFSESYLKFDGSVEVNFALGLNTKAELLGYLEVAGGAVNLRIGTSIEWDAKAGADAVLTKGNVGCNGAVLNSGLTHYAEYCEQDLAEHKKHLKLAEADGDLVFAIGFWYYIPLPALLVWAEFKMEALGCDAGPTHQLVHSVRDGLFRGLALHIGKGPSFTREHTSGADNLFDFSNIKKSMGKISKNIKYAPGDELWEKMTAAEKEKETNGFTHPLVNYKKNRYDGYSTTPFLLRNTWAKSWKLNANFGSDGKWYFMERPRSKSNKPRAEHPPLTSTKGQEHPLPKESGGAPRAPSASTSTPRSGSLARFLGQKHPPQPAPLPVQKLSGQLLDGCADRPQPWSATWGDPRLENPKSKAGAVVCCGPRGAVTRCTTKSSRCSSSAQCLSGQATKSGIGKATYGWARAKCQGLGAGWDLCDSQEQIDRSCGTGCKYDHALVWTKG
jgi:hypothetical protein